MKPAQSTKEISATAIRQTGSDISTDLHNQSLKFILKTLTVQKMERERQILGKELKVKKKKRGCNSKARG